MGFQIKPTVADHKVRINLPDGTWFDMFSGDAIQFGGVIICKAYEAAGIPVPPTLTLNLQP